MKLKSETKTNTRIILSEIEIVLSRINEDEVEALANSILKAKRVVCCGAGRVGMSVKAFAMRLKHLGHDAYFLGDANVPSITNGDLLLVGSGSGETQTIYDLAKIAGDHDVEIALITGNPLSRIGQLADRIVKIDAPNKNSPPGKFKSRQPMTSLNEQCLWIFFDALVLKLMRLQKISEKDMHARHSILE